MTFVMKAEEAFCMGKTIYSLYSSFFQELGDHGWRIQAALDIASTQKGYKQTHPYSLFLMR